MFHWQLGRETTSTLTPSKIHSSQSKMELILSIKVFTPNNCDVPSLVVKPVPKHHWLMKRIQKLPTIYEEQPDSEPFGDQPLSWSTLLCFLFEEQFANVPLSWLPPLCFPPLSYVPHSTPLKNLPPSTYINNLEDQIKFTLHYENLINQLEAYDNEPPMHWIYKQQLELKELSSVEILAN